MGGCLRFLDIVATHPQCYFVVYYENVKSEAPAPGNPSWMAIFKRSLVDVFLFKHKTWHPLVCMGKNQFHKFGITKPPPL